MDAKWCRPGTSHGEGWHKRYLCGFTGKNQPVWGPSLKNVGEDDMHSWRTKKLEPKELVHMNAKDAYFAKTACAFTDSRKGPPKKRAKKADPH